MDNTNVYEGLFILDSNNYASDPAGTSGVVEQVIKNHGGELLVSRLWDERRLAYPIAGQRKGSYWLTYFKLEGPNLTKVEREIQISDKVLRGMVIKVEPRLIDALVAHAQAGDARPMAATAPGVPGAPAAAAPPAATPPAAAPKETAEDSAPAKVASNDE